MMCGIVIWVEGNKMDMGVGDVGTNDFQEGALAKDIFVMTGKLLDGGHDGSVIGIVEIVETIDFDFRDDEGVTERLGLDVKEGIGTVVFVNFIAREFTLNDLRENCTHEVIIARLFIAGGDVFLDEGDFAEVMIPHADETFAGVGGIAEIGGFRGVLVERGGEIASVGPVTAAAGRGERRDSFELGEPATTPIVAAKNPKVLTVVRGVDGEDDVSGKGRITIEGGEWRGEVRSEVGVDGDKLRSVFITAGRLPVSEDRVVIDFGIEIAVEAIVVESFAVILESVIGRGGAGEKKIRINGGNLLKTGGFDEGGELLLEGDRESNGGGAVAVGGLAHAFGARAANNVGGEIPKTGLRIEIITAEFVAASGAVGGVAVVGREVTEDGATTVAELEGSGEKDGLAVESSLGHGGEGIVDEIGDSERILGAVLTPGVAGDGGLAEDFVAAVGGERRERGSEGGACGIGGWLQADWRLRGLFRDDGVEVF